MAKCHDNRRAKERRRRREKRIEERRRHDCSWDLITCWCGAVGTAEELFDYSCLDRACGGTGSLTCYCGGDFCVCHHHGEVECVGCPDCEGEPDDDYDDDYDFHGEE